MKLFSPVGCPTFRGQKVVKHGGHHGISYLFIGSTRGQSVILWQSYCASRVVRTIAYLKAILCTISLAIYYVSDLFCAHLCAVLINFNCNGENRISGKLNHEI